MPKKLRFIYRENHNMSDAQKAIQKKAMQHIFNCHTYLKRMHHSECDPDEQREKAMVEARKAFFTLDPET